MKAYDKINDLTIHSNEVDHSCIPDSAIEEMARCVLEIAERIMSLPEMQEKFEAWKRKRGITECEVVPQ